MISVSLCTDEPLLACGFLAVLSDCTGFSGTSIEDPRSPIPTEIPDILVLDWTAHPDLDFISALKSRLPQTHLIVWVRDIAVDLASRLLAIGVRGILRKTLKPEEFLSCIRVVANGEMWLDSKLTSELLTARQIHFSPRETQLVSLLSQGLKNKEIAAEMCLSEGTVKIYLSRLFQKAGVKDRFELALLGLKNVASNPHRAVFPSTTIHLSAEYASRRVSVR